MLLDLHTHTRIHSLDASLSPDDLVEGAKASHLDGICITEHDWFWDLNQIATLGKRHNFLVLPGCEINTEQGHTLVFGLQRYVYGMHRPAYLRLEVERTHGVMLAAHPYRRQFVEEEGPWVPPYERQVEQAAQGEHVSCAHAVETINGRGKPRQNKFSHDVCLRAGLPAIGASDSHDLGDIGVCATRFERRIAGLTDLIEELRAGRYTPVRLR